MQLSFSVLLLDSKAQQTELEWISSPPNGVSASPHKIPTSVF